MKKLLIKVLCGIIVAMSIMSVCITTFGDANSFPSVVMQADGNAAITQITRGEDKDCQETRVEEILVNKSSTTLVKGKQCNSNSERKAMMEVEEFPPEIEEELIFNEEGPSYVAEEVVSAAVASEAPVVQTEVPTEAPTEPIIETQPVIETQPETQPIIETQPETQPAPPQTEAPPQVTSPIYAVNGAVMSEDLQTYLYNRLTERGISWFMPYALANAYQESRFNIYAENPNGLDKGLFQYRITYYPGANIFDPYEQIIIYCDQMANRLNSGCSVEDAISRHMMSDYGPYNASYVQLIMSWFSVTVRIR